METQAEKTRTVLCRKGKGRIPAADSNCRVALASKTAMTGSTFGGRSHAHCTLMGFGSTFSHGHRALHQFPCSRLAALFRRSARRERNLRKQTTKRPCRTGHGTVGGNGANATLHRAAESEAAVFAVQKWDSLLRRHAKSAKSQLNGSILKKGKVQGKRQPAITAVLRDVLY